MAERVRRSGGVRVRTTLAAVGVVGVALVLGAVALVLLLRASLVEGLEQAAEARASTLVEQADAGTIPEAYRGDSGRSADDAGGDGDDDGDGLEREDEVWQVVDRNGALVASSGDLGGYFLPVGTESDSPVPGGFVGDDDESSSTLPGGDDQRYVLEFEGTDDGGVVTVALSREEVDDSTGALVPLLAVGVPVLLLLVGGVTWLTTGRALAPVERIRSEVEGISGDRLDRRVPVPRSRDEVRRLAVTMNRMLTRLERSRTQQQRFVADASHELRSPIASLRQTAEVERAHPGALGEGELAEAVVEESERMQRLVEQLLVLTRADEGRVVSDPREVDVDDLALAEARRVRRTGLDVDTSAVTAARVHGDAVALGQVTRNLVDNAARHARSCVALSVREVPEGVELVVADDGPGVPESQRERVFERFVRLDDARSRDAGGSGLGLAIVAEVVRAHDGTVAVGRSEALGGAAFRVVLPPS